MKEIIIYYLIKKPLKKEIIYTSSYYEKIIKERRWAAHSPLTAHSRDILWVSRSLTQVSGERERPFCEWAGGNSALWCNTLGCHYVLIQNEDMYLIPLHLTFFYFVH